MDNRAIIALTRLTKACSAGQSLDQILERVYSDFEGVTPFTRIGYATTERDATGSTMVVANWSRSHRTTRLKNGFAQPLQGSSLEIIAKRRQPRILNDLRGYLVKRPQSKSTRLIVEEGIQSSLTVPVFLQTELIGFIFFSHHRPNVYSAVDVDLAMCLAEWVAMKVQVQSATDSAESTLSGAISALQEMLGMANPIAADHAARMRQRLNEFTGQIDQFLLTKAKVASGLCNLGYVGVSEDTTSRALCGETLTPDEQEQITAQFQMSSQLLHRIPSMRETSEIIRSLEDPDNAAPDLRQLVGLLRAISDFESLMSQGMKCDDAFKLLRANSSSEAIEHMKIAVPSSAIGGIPRAATLLSQNLEIGMIVNRPILSKSGKVLLTRGVRLSQEIIDRIQKYDFDGQLNQSQIAVLTPGK